MIADAHPPKGAWEHLIGWFIENRLIVAVLTVMLIAGGIYVSPFSLDNESIPQDPVPVDAIPDIGENQQIVFTQWPGRSPRDVEDQITYPLTTSLLGIAGVRTVRSSSAFGFSTIYVIFNDDVEFYWSRSRVLEKLASLAPGTVPPSVTPTLGPDATALGQIYWYTLQGQDPQGNVVGGWDPDELRSIQDWTVRYALQSVSGVGEVASIGGYVREYQVDVDPEAMLANGVTLSQVANAVRNSNLDVGARTMEINSVEYMVRGLGFVREVSDLEQTVVLARQHTPIRISDIGHVTLGPALRRGALDDAGAPAVGGVVVARFMENPLQVISSVKEKIAQIQPGLPRRTLEDGTVSQVTIVPFYDRTTLINETLSTLSTALYQEILITVIVVLIMLRNLRSSLLISAMLPLGVLGAFIVMKLTGVDANIMALGGIAIAIGTMVDIGIVFVENINRQLEEQGGLDPLPPPPELEDDFDEDDFDEDDFDDDDDDDEDDEDDDEDDDDDDDFEEDSSEAEQASGPSRIAIIRGAAAEVAPAVTTSVLTTVVSFLPVFGLSATELRLFAPLAYTKTFAMSAALILAVVVLPAAALVVLRRAPTPAPETGSVFQRLAGSMFRAEHLRDWFLLALGIVLAQYTLAGGAVVVALAAYRLARPVLSDTANTRWGLIETTMGVLVVAVLLAEDWMPLGPESGFLLNFVAVALALGLVLGTFRIFEHAYPRLLAWLLGHKALFLLMPLMIVVFGATAWLGFDRVFGWLPQSVRVTPTVSRVAHAMPGFGREYMPDFDEGSYLYMPTNMPHASIGETLTALSEMDAAIAQIPEVDRVVGKLGRVDSALDPAPISMFENIITYKPEYRVQADGTRVRQWRDEIQSPKDIWDEIVKAAERPGMTSAPVLMPINARIVMLQSGMRAPMGIKVRGPSLEAIERFGLDLEPVLRAVASVRDESVFADRVVGKPYIEIDLDRDAIGRYGLSIVEVQGVLQVALGGMTLTRTVEGRERYPVRVRYMREERDSMEALDRILVPTKGGEQIPLTQLAEIRYVRGPQMIKSEDTFLTSYVLFDKVPDTAEVEVVEQAQAAIELAIESGELEIPAGVSYEFSGSYENQLRSEASLLRLIPVTLAFVFMLLYLQFHRTSTSLVIYSGVAVAVSGGFILLWLYGQPWFLDFDLFGTSARELFQVHTINMSVAVWIGFIALVGIATDDGVVMSTYLKQLFERTPPNSVEQVRALTLEAGVRRVRPCLMTTATTILALLPVITSTGRGADIMMPMALPSIGGMAIELMTLFVVPVLYCAVEERRVLRKIPRR